MTNVVVFSGGRGTRFIHEALSGVDVRLTFLVNGYDSGLSTGRIRWAFDGILGPSDFRKTVSTSLEHLGGRYGLQSRLLEDRTIVNKLNIAVRRDGLIGVLSTLADEYPDLALDTLHKYVKPLLEFLDSVPVLTGSLNLNDLPLGNALLAGAFLRSGDFNEAVENLNTLIPKQANIELVNVTNGDDLWLCALTDSQLTVNEGSIVAEHPTSPITDLILVERETARTYWEKFETWQHISREERQEILAHRLLPEASQSSLDAISRADLIVYGSGTQSSSLLPSYLTRGILDAIASNRTAAKLMLVNGERDKDFALSEDTNAFIQKVVRSFEENSTAEISELVDRIYLPANNWQSRKKESVAGGSNLLVNVDVRRYGSTILSANDLYNGFSAIIGQTLGHEITPSEAVVSMVCPILNEESRLPTFLSECESFNTINELQVEKILVDGGSTDSTNQILDSCSWATALEVGMPIGRAACIQRGIRHARGEYVAIMHADLEYSLKDLAEMVRVAQASHNTIVWGSRMHGPQSDSNLRKAYAEDRKSYWMSRFGGVLVSGLLSLRMGRLISDPFCGLIVGRREDLVQIIDGHGSIDSNVRTLLRAKARKMRILELGVSYSPRTRSQGKKTTAAQGMRALWACIAPTSSNEQ